MSRSYKKFPIWRCTNDRNSMKKAKQRANRKLRRYLKQNIYDIIPNR